MPISEPPAELDPSLAEGSLWQDVRDLARFVAEAAIVSGGIVLAALALI